MANLISFGVPALAGRFSSRLKAVHRTRKTDFARPLNSYRMAIRGIYLKKMVIVRPDKGAFL
jgi:hypothetical protein